MEVPLVEQRKEAASRICASATLSSRRECLKSTQAATSPRTKAMTGASALEAQVVKRSSAAAPKIPSLSTDPTESPVSAATAPPPQFTKSAPISAFNSFDSSSN